MSNIVIIPMKAHNVRLPGKNLKMLGGKPLCHWMIDMLHEAKHVDKIILDLNGIELIEHVLKEVSLEKWQKVTVSPRPHEYCDGKIGGNQLLERFQDDWDDDDIIAQMHVTSPFLRTHTIDAAFLQLSKDRRKESLFSATPVIQRVWMWSPNGPKAVNFDPDGPTERTQDLPECAHENGAFFMFKGSYFHRTQQRNGSDSRMYMLSFPETVDVDTADDFEIAELVIERMKNAHQHTDNPGRHT